MGLSTERKNSGKGNIYLKVMNGALIQDVKEGTPDAVARVNKNGETVHELKYTGLTMRITNIALIDGKFGKELEVKGNADSQNFVLQMPAGSGYAYGFLTRMVNLDFNTDTEIVPYQIVDKANPKKINNVLVLYQGTDENGKSIKIESAFTKENDFNGMPQLEKIMDAKNPEKPLLVNGKEVWSDAKRLEFFEAIIYGESGINDKLIELYGSTEEKAESEDKTSFTEEVNEDALEQSKAAGALDTKKAVAGDVKADAKKKTKK